METPALESTILVVSRDLFFAKPLAQQIASELAMPCVAVEQADAPLTPSVALIVTNEQAVEYACPVLRVTPPLRMQRVLDDITAALKKQSGDVVMLGSSYRLHSRQKELARVSTGASVALTDKEMQLLQCLAAGDVVGREQLLKDIWGMDSANDTHTLETHIYRLRAKFRELAEDEMVIACEGGYKLRMG